jgi:hypothetical protein
VPEDEPGITAPEPETLPEEPDITPPDSAGQRNLDDGRSIHVGTHSRTGDADQLLPGDAGLQPKPGFRHRHARENSHWGYVRIVGELRKLGITASATLVRNVLARAGIPPAPERAASSWRVGCMNSIALQIGQIGTCDRVSVPVGVHKLDRAANPTDSNT